MPCDCNGIVTINLINMYIEIFLKRCGMLLEQFLYIGILVIVGVIVLSLRRKAEGSRTGYKLVLVLLGLLLGMISLGESSALHFDKYFLKSFCVFLLIILLFELSVRLNPDNIHLDFFNVTMFLAILMLNVFVLGMITSLLVNINFIHGVIFAIVLSSIEYFLVDQLKGEGDLANPFIILFAFSIMVFYAIEGNTFDKAVYFLRYMVTGIGMGVLAGIIVFRSLRNQYVTPANELGMVAVAVATYILAEQLAGSGLFAVLVLGTFFGNSFVRKTTHMHRFSPFIFKTLEMLIFLMIGFVVVIHFRDGLWWKSLVLFFIYILLRLLIIHLYYKHYSMDNKLLLAFAPKGMILGVMILVLGVYGSVEDSLLVVMLFVLLYGLIAGIFVEYIEQQKELNLDKLLKSILTRKFRKARASGEKRKKGQIYL
jgi:NhaP-type Na+/H+ and K+/H+ antiporter